MTEKRFIMIVDHTEKEVRIFDEFNKKNLFNIFFNELDSAICLGGALTDTVDLLNEFAREIEQLNHDLDLYEENNTNEVLNALRIELTSRLNDCFEEFKQ